MTEEKVIFKDSEGNKVCGVLSNPTGDKNKPIIILCHGGFPANKGARHVVRIAEILNKKGISVFRFDFFGHGESEGKFEDITISMAVDDVLSSIKFLKKLGYSKIGLTGSSFGGIVALVAASKIDNLLVLALKSPVSNYEDLELLIRGKKEIEEWKKKGYAPYEVRPGENTRLNYTFFEDFKNNNGYEAAKKINIPTLIVHGDKDESVPVEQSKKTAKIIKNCRLEIIKGADHGYSKPEDFEKMLSLISNFIINNL